MSGKGTSLADQAALTALTWTVLKSFYDRKHITGTSKLDDFKDSKYGTKKGLKKEAVMANLSQESKDIIQEKIKERIRDNPNEEKKDRAQNIAGSLIGDNSFLQSIGNIFTSIFTGTSPQPSDDEEEQPQPEEEQPEVKPRSVPKLTEPQEDDTDSDDEITSSFLTTFFNRIKKEMKTQKGKDIVDRNLKNLKDVKFDGNLGEAYILNALRDIRNADEDITDNIVRQYNTYKNKYRDESKFIKKNALLKKLSPAKKISTKPKLVEEEEEPQPVPTKEKVSVPLLDEMIKNVSRPVSGGEGVGLTPKELKAIRERKGKPIKKVPKTKSGMPTKRAITEEAVATALREAGVSTKKNVTTGFEEMGQRLDDINARLSSIPELKQIHADVVQQLKREGYDLKKTDTKLQGLGIDKKIVEELIKTIPEDNRAILAPAVRSIASSGGVNMNNVIAGLVGLGVSMSGNPAIGTAITPIISGMMNTYGVDLNKYFDVGEILDEPEKPQPEGEPVFGRYAPQTYFRSQMPGSDATTDELAKWLQENRDIEAKISEKYPADSLIYRQVYKKFLKRMEDGKHSGTDAEIKEQQIDEDVYDVISGVVEESQPEATQETKRNYIIDSLLALPETIKKKISELKRSNPTETPSQILRDVSVDYDIDEDLELGGQLPRQPQRAPYSGAGEGFVQGAGVGGMYGGVSAGLSTGSAQGAVSGIIPGAIAGGIAGLTTEQLLRRYYRQQRIPITDDIKQRIKSLSSLPAMAVATYLGYTSSGRVQDVAGQGILSGAGITEKKITVEPEVLAHTQAKIDQDDSKNKQWQPKTITPTPNILDESKQEKYADDVEFVAFNYIPPTSEGAEGTVDTNPLKYQQLLESKIRYTNAGVYIPYLTWNKINDANNMTSQQLKTIMMGPELPRMKFNTFDNDTTFENVAKWQYVNNENTAVEYQSPYADFSNVENSWWSNETSELFTINP